VTVLHCTVHCLFFAIDVYCIFAAFVKKACYFSEDYYPNDFHAWTAGHRIEPGKKPFHWKLNGNHSLPMVYTKWLPTNPDNAGNGQNCLQLLEKRNGWDDMACTKKLCFVCEIEL